MMLTFMEATPSHCVTVTHQRLTLADAAITWSVIVRTSVIDDRTSACLRRWPLRRLGCAAFDRRRSRRRATKACGFRLEIAVAAVE